VDRRRKLRESLLKRFGLAVAAAALAASAPAWAEDKQPVTQKTCTELLSFYKSLPFTDVLPIAEGPVSIRARRATSRSASRRRGSIIPGVLLCWRRYKLRPADIRT
jgi:hypothetical protein